MHLDLSLHEESRGMLLLQTLQRVLLRAAALAASRRLLRHEFDKTRCQEVACRYRLLMAGSSNPPSLTAIGQPQIG
jgi:hypothetical protein